MYKYVQNALWSLEANLNVIFKRKIALGASYRFGKWNDDSIDFLAFFQATECLGFGAGYHLTLSKLSSYNTGSIEALLRYDFSKLTHSKTDKEKVQENKNRLSNPRYFF